MSAFQLADPILTTGDVQELLRIKSRNTITKLVKEGKLRSLPRNPGQKYTFLASEVQRYVDDLAGQALSNKQRKAA